MKKRFTQEQIIKILQEASSGLTVEEAFPGKLMTGSYFLFINRVRMLF